MNGLYIDCLLLRLVVAYLKSSSTCSNAQLTAGPVVKYMYTPMFMLRISPFTTSQFLAQATEIRSIYADDSNVSIGSLVTVFARSFLDHKPKGQVTDKF